MMLKMLWLLFANWDTAIHDWLTHGNTENDTENGLGRRDWNYLAAGYFRDHA